MSILTLTPFRSAPNGSFARGAFAYAFADRPVRIKGELITAVPLYATAGDDGMIAFDLVPSHESDNGVVFSYTVAVYDSQARRMWGANIVMPNYDVSVWSLIPKHYSLDDARSTTGEHS